MEYALTNLKTATIENRSALTNVGFAAKLRLIVKNLRNKMNAVDYKQVADGLIFLLICYGVRIGDIAVNGQESNSTTRRNAMINLAIRSIEGDLGPKHADKREAAISTNCKELRDGS